MVAGGRGQGTVPGKCHTVMFLAQTPCTHASGGRTGGRQLRTGARLHFAYAFVL